MTNDLGIDTTGWLRGCGVPGCRWLLDPAFPDCPEHNDRATPLPPADEIQPKHVAESAGAGSEKGAADA